MKSMMVLATCSLFSTCLLAGNWAAFQEPDAPTASMVPVQGFPGPFNVARGSYNVAVAGFQAGEKANAVNAALKAMKSAEDDAARRKAESELNAALEADYDSRLEGYEKHLDQLEAELAKMRDQLQKRKMAKSDMVSLRLQVLKAEADDLGWPSEVDPRSGNRLFRSGAASPSGATWIVPNYSVAPAPAVRAVPAAVPSPPDGGGR